MIAMLSIHEFYFKGIRWVVGKGQDGGGLNYV